MWALRIVKNYKTNKIDSAVVYNDILETFESCNNKKLKQMLLYGANIYNLKLQNGQVTTANVNPEAKRKAYLQYYIEDLQMNNYIVITKMRNDDINEGVPNDYVILDIVAIDKNGKQVKLYNATLKEIMERLSIKELKDLRFLNAKIDDYTIKNDSLQIRYWNIPNNFYEGYYYIPVCVTYANIYVETLNSIYKYKLINENSEQHNICNIEQLEVRDGKEKNSETLPNGIKTLLKFNGGINNIIMPPSIEKIGVGCFSELQDLDSIDLKDSNIDRIPAKCFEDSTIKRIRLTPKQKLIDTRAFSGCNKLEKVNSYANIISKYAFADSGIEAIKLQQCEAILPFAFSYCNKLKTVVFDRTLTQIESNAFEYCTGLQVLKFNSELKIIRKNAFKGCKHLEKVIIPKSCKIEDGAFPSTRKPIQFKWY